MKKIKLLEQVSSSKQKDKKIIYLGDLQTSENPKYTVFYNKKFGILNFECKDESQKRNKQEISIMCANGGDKIRYIYSNFSTYAHSKETYIQAMTEHLPKLSMWMSKAEFDRYYELYTAKNDLTVNMGYDIYYFYIGNNLFSTVGEFNSFLVFIPDRHNIMIGHESDKSSFDPEKIKSFALEMKFTKSESD